MGLIDEYSVSKLSSSSPARRWKRALIFGQAGSDERFDTREQFGAVIHRVFRSIHGRAETDSHTVRLREERFLELLAKP